MPALVPTRLAIQIARAVGEVFEGAIYNPLAPGTWTYLPSSAGTNKSHLNFDNGISLSGGGFIQALESNGYE